MKKYILCITLFLNLCLLSLSAQDTAAADSAYAQTNYQAAASLYEKLLSQHKTPLLYYNLGNCYYRLGEPSKALLNYERAALLDPADKDVRANIAFVESQLWSKTTRSTQVFWVLWWNALGNSQNLYGWALWGVVTFLLFLACLSLYFFARALRARKAGFFGAFLFLCICVVSNLYAYGQYKRLTQRNTALVLTEGGGGTVRSAPTDTGTALTTLPDGVKVTVTDRSMKDWKEIEFEDGKVGWIKSAEIETI